jgi:thiol:disulfide interchange protein DsbD
LLPAQPNSVVTVAPLQKAHVARGGDFTQHVPVQVKPGFHVNSDKPEDEYLIPLKLTWTGPLQAVDVVFPKPERMKSTFSEKPLVVYTGTFDIVTKFKVPATAPDGPNLAVGKLRYQACNDKECLRPQTVEVNLSLDIK